MSEVAILRQALRAIPSLGGEWAFETLNENVYRLAQGERRYFTKWIADDDEHGRNELEINRTVLPQSGLPVPKLLHVLPAGQGRLAIWEWAGEEDLRAQGRDLLPQAFRLLGNFHAGQRHPGQLSSPVTNKTYPSVPDLLQGEAEDLGGLLPPAWRPRCAAGLAVLECGYPTLIHGDMHPGNLRRTQQGVLFVDWGYARRSLNLFDLDYIRSIGLDEDADEWWHIRPPEAERILPDYFAAAGLGALGHRAVHRGVMLWAALWAHYNVTRAHDFAGQKVCRRRIEMLLEA
jgi:hypothetical protein